MRDTIEEQWLPIEGYEGYEVSNLGRVRRVKGYDSLGHLRDEKILKPTINKYGYLKVCLCKEGKHKTPTVHRLVAQAFIPNPEELPVINHKDEDKTNNRVDNLEWCTVKYNVNYGTGRERAAKNRIQSGIDNGTYDPELCGLDEKEYKRLYRQKNRGKLNEQARLLYQKDREKNNERSREYYQKNRDQILEQKREYRQKNRDHIMELKREYQQKNRDKWNEYQREYRLKKKQEKKDNRPSEMSLW